MELKQSMKFIKKYDSNKYTMIINRVKIDEDGEYIIRAKNSYGTTEEKVYLTVLSTFFLLC